MTPLTRGGEKLRESATIGQNILMKKVLIQSYHVEEFLGLLIRRGVWHEPVHVHCEGLTEPIDWLCAVAGHHMDWSIIWWDGLK